MTKQKTKAGRLTLADLAAQIAIKPRTPQYRAEAYRIKSRAITAAKQMSAKPPRPRKVNP